MMHKHLPIVRAHLTKTAVDNPLLKVPPARRGNRVGAPFAVPLAKRGEPKEGAIVNSARAIGIEARTSENCLLKV